MVSLSMSLTLVDFVDTGTTAINHFHFGTSKFQTHSFTLAIFYNGERGRSRSGGYFARARARALAGWALLPVVGGTVVGGVHPRSDRHYATELRYYPRLYCGEVRFYPSCRSAAHDRSLRGQGPAGVVHSARHGHCR